MLQPAKHRSLGRSRNSCGPEVQRPGKFEPVFSRDCPEFTVELSGGLSLIVLGNHFKSQGYGNKANNDAKRLDQAKAVKTIYHAALLRSPLVVVAGDLNAGPDDPSVAPLVKTAGLREVMKRPSYQGLPLPGTYGTGTNRDRQKIDYILPLAIAVGPRAGNRR